MFLMPENKWARLLAYVTGLVNQKLLLQNSKKAGVDAKVSADQRGHGLGVSMEVYTVSDRQQKLEAVRRLESMVARKRQRKLSA
jgi:hypothetical protein